MAKSEYGVDAESETEEGLSTSLDELLAPPASLYLAELDGSAVGLGGVKSVTPDVAEIKRMYVRPSARGRGIGRALLAWLVEDARALGARSVRLESAGFMVEAHTLYRSFGFAAIEPFAGREFEDVPGAEEIQVFMALNLDG